MMAVPAMGTEEKAVAKLYETVSPLLTKLDFDAGLLFDIIRVPAWIFVVVPSIGGTGTNCEYIYENKAK